MALHQRHRLVRVELAESVSQHRNAMMPSRHQNIEQPADPRPIRRSPEQIVRLREEFMRQLHTGQMPKQHPMPMKRPLRAARRAGGVDDDGGIIRPGIDRREHIRSPRQRLLKANGSLRRAINAEHQFQTRQPVANGATFSYPTLSVTSTRAPLSPSRYSSASAPNRANSGIVISPALKPATWAIAVSGACGSRTASRSPR